MHSSQEAPNAEDGEEDGAEAGVPEGQANVSTWAKAERVFVAIHFDSPLCVVLVGEKGRRWPGRLGFLYFNGNAILEPDETVLRKRRSHDAPSVGLLRTVSVIMSKFSNVISS